MLKLTREQVEAVAADLIAEAKQKRDADYQKITNLKIVEEMAQEDYDKIKRCWESVSDTIKHELDELGEITYRAVKAAHINKMAEELPEIPEQEKVCRMIYKLTITAKTLEDITSQINLYQESDIK